MDKKKLIILLIPDGNGRSAEQEGKPRSFGHVCGAQALVSFLNDLDVSTMLKDKIGRIVFFGAATANFTNRNPSEMQAICQVTTDMLRCQGDDLIDKGYNVRFVGRRDRIGRELCAQIESIELRSLQGDRELVIAFDYSESWDREQAVLVLRDDLQSGSLAVTNIIEDEIRKRLALHGERIDLCIRTGVEENRGRTDYFVTRPSDIGFTGGEQAVWMALSVLWPDFTIDHLREAILKSGLDQRLFGGDRT